MPESQVTGYVRTEELKAGTIVFGFDKTEYDADDVIQFVVIQVDEGYLEGMTTRLVPLKSADYVSIRGGLCLPPMDDLAVFATRDEARHAKRMNVENYARTLIEQVQERLT